MHSNSFQFKIILHNSYSNTNPPSPTQVKAAEDILSLTRTLKEAWLFGKLQTIGTSEAETRARTAAAKVAEGLKELGDEDAGSGEGK